MVGIAIIGCGAITTWRHAPECANNENINLCGVYDINLERAKIVAEQFGTKAYNTYEEVLDDSAVDGVIISVANKFHCEMTLKAFESEKHVLCEKPIAISVEEADKMIEASKKAGKFLMIAHSQRYDGAHLKAKEILSSGILGKIITFDTCFITGGPDNWSVDKGSGTWFLNKNMAGLGAMGDIGIHKADLVHYFLDEDIKYATAFVGTLDKKGSDGELIGIDDNGMCILESESGVKGVLRASWTGYGRGCNRTTLYCENGILEVDNDENEQIKIYFKNGDTQSIHVEVKDSLMASTFAKCIETDTSPEIDGEAGKKALNLVLKCIESSKQNRRIEV